MITSRSPGDVAGITSVAARADSVVREDGGVAAGGRRRGFETVGDMLRSLAVVLVLVLGVSLLTLRSSSEQVRTVEYESELASARNAAPYPLYAPVGLDGWRATSVRFEPGGDSGTPTVWHLGFYTPDERYAAIDESNGPAEDFLDDITQSAESTGATVTIGELAWVRYEGGGAAGTDDETRGLVHDEEGFVVVVSGSAEWPELEELAAALSAR
jgi:hypothetical protein